MRARWIGIVAFFVIALLPMGAIVLSFIGNWPPGFSFDFLHLLKNSLLVAVLTTAVALILGFPYAFLVGKTSLPRRNIWLGLCVLPLLIPAYIKAVVWITILGKGGLLMRLTGIHIDIFNIYGTAFVLGTSYFPIITFMLIFAFQFINPAYEEAASLHFPAGRVFRSITMPMCMNSLMVGLLIVFCLAFTNFNVPVHLGVNVYAVEVFSYFEAFYDYNYVFLASLPVLLCLVPLFALTNFFTSRIPMNTIAHKYQAKPLELKSNLLSYLFLSIVLSVSLIISLACLLIKTGGLSAFFRVFNVAGREIANSIVFALIATIVLLPVALLISCSVMKSSKFSHFLMPLLLPGTLLGIGLIKILNRPLFAPVYSSPFSLIIIYVIRFLPVAVIGLVFFVKKIQPSMIEAALMSKRSLQVVFRIVLPLIKNGMILVGFIVFAFCLGELDATALLVSPGNATIPVHIFSLMHYGADNVVAALCIIIIVIILVMLLLVSRIGQYAYNKT